MPPTVSRMLFHMLVINAYVFCICPICLINDKIANDNFATMVTSVLLYLLKFTHFNCLDYLKCDIFIQHKWFSLVLVLYFIVLRFYYIGINTIQYCIYMFRGPPNVFSGCSVPILPSYFFTTFLKAVVEMIASAPSHA